MASPVYLLRIADWKNLDLVAERLRDLLARAPLLDGARSGHPAAVKLTFGEKGNTAYPPVRLVREVVSALGKRGARPFLTETNTLYHGQRKNALDHLELARQHGFTHESVGAPIILGDGVLGRDVHEFPLGGPHVKTAHLAPVLRDCEFLVSLAHVTGHLLVGFGGAMKNIGMGLAGRAGKLEMHRIVRPVVEPGKCTACLRCVAACAANAITPPRSKARAKAGGAAGPNLRATRSRAVTIDASLCTGCADCLAVCPSGAISINWSDDSQQVQERIAEYALAVSKMMANRLAYINLLNHISDHCDCLGATPRLISPDIGIAASLDPVALDQASIDLVRAASGGDAFGQAWPKADCEAQLRHAETIGLGNRAYEVVEF